MKVKDAMHVGVVWFAPDEPISKIAAVNQPGGADSPARANLVEFVLERVIQGSRHRGNEFIPEFSHLMMHPVCC
jgi:hypothetical protein